MILVSCIKNIRSLFYNHVIVGVQAAVQCDLVANVGSKPHDRALAELLERSVTSSLSGGAR